MFCSSRIFPNECNDSSTSCFLLLIHMFIPLRGGQSYECLHTTSYNSLGAVVLLSTLAERDDRAIDDRRHIGKPSVGAMKASRWVEAREFRHECVEERCWSAACRRLIESLEWCMLDDRVPSRALACDRQHSLQRVESIRSKLRSDTTCLPQKMFDALLLEVHRWA